MRTSGAGSGDDSDAMVHAHLGLATRAVAKVRPRLPAHVGRDDLHAAALLGLVHAARSYDPDRGVPFELYAARRVDGAILDELRKADWATRGMRRREREIDEATGTLAATLHRAPTTDEVAAAVGLDATVVERAHADRARASLLQLDRLVESGDAEQALPAASSDDPERRVVEQDDFRELHQAIEALPTRLRRVVEAQYIEGRSGADLAEEFGVSAARILQLRREALTLLAHALGAPRPLLAADRRGPSARRVAAYRATLASRGHRPSSCTAGLATPA